MTLAEEAEAPDRSADESSATRIVYLLGAGATQGSVQYQGSRASLVMPGLIQTLTARMRERYMERYSAYEGVGRLVNDVVDDSTDFEQLITFLEDTPSGVFRSFAADLKSIFSSVLRAALADVREELAPNYSDLYAVLLDMHAVPESGEVLRGFMTLNYDDLLEHAIATRVGRRVDYGLDIRGVQGNPGSDIPVLKLHGSFGWRDTWPIELGPENDPGLWIPPGIRKAKTDYPFNAIWGAARELLDCDVLRIIGCNLGPNDWDLVSLLFTTMHARDTQLPYEVEVIARPRTAEKIASLFPYLAVKSLLELPGIGEQLVAEVAGGRATELTALEPAERDRAIDNANAKIGNPFEHWLRLKGELMHQDLPTINTQHGIFAAFVEAGA